MVYLIALSYADRNITKLFLTIIVQVDVGLSQLHTYRFWNQTGKFGVHVRSRHVTQAHHSQCSVIIVLSSRSVLAAGTIPRYDT